MVSALRRIRSELRVLFTSGYAADVHADAVLKAGMAFMSKPFTPSQLARRLRGILDDVSLPRHLEVG